MIRNPAFFFNADVCTGCKTCVIACKDKHNLPPGVLWRQVWEITGGEWVQTGEAYEQNVFAYYLSISCNHCQNATCVEVCPTGAMRKDENGIVSVHGDRCSGCRACERSCPYSAPRFNPETGQTGKCDFCKDALERGLPPACVAACPSRALECGEYAAMVAKYGAPAPMAALPDPATTGPHLICAPSRHDRSASGPHSLPPWQVR